MSTAAALAVALPSSGVIVAVVVAMWRALGSRMDEQGSRLDEHGRRLDAIDGRLDAVGERFDAVGERFDAIGGRIGGVGGRIDEVTKQQGAILRALGRIEGHLRIPAEPADAAAGQTRNPTAATPALSP